MAIPANGMRINTIFDKGDGDFDVCEINGSRFALFSKQIRSDVDLSIDLKDYNVVFLSPLEVEQDLCIKAITVIILTTLNAIHGKSEISASEKFISLGGRISAYGQNKISGNKGVYVFGGIKERLEMIRNEFIEGISNEHGPTIVNALVDTFDAIEDPLGENDGIDRVKAFEFFNIPIID